MFGGTMRIIPGAPSFREPLAGMDASCCQLIFGGGDHVDANTALPNGHTGNDGLGGRRRALRIVIIRPQLVELFADVVVRDVIRGFD